MPTEAFGRRSPINVTYCAAFSQSLVNRTEIWILKYNTGDAPWYVIPIPLFRSPCTNNSQTPLNGPCCSRNCPVVISIHRLTPDFCSADVVRCLFAGYTIPLLNPPRAWFKTLMADAHSMKAQTVYIPIRSYPIHKTRRQATCGGYIHPTTKPTAKTRKIDARSRTRRRSPSRAGNSPTGDDDE